MINGICLFDDDGDDDNGNGNDDENNDDDGAECKLLQFSDV